MKKQFPITNSLRRCKQRDSGVTPEGQTSPAGSTFNKATVECKGCRIEVQWNEKNEEATIAILDTIGKDPWTDGGFTEKDFRSALKDIPQNKTLNLLINSRGGDVFEGFGIKNAIAEWPNRVTATITGVAASTASWMILDADEVRAPKASQMFIHEAMTIGAGNAADLREVADRLDTTSEQIAGFYAAKNGKSVAEMRELMKKNTLMTGARAHELGLVDVLTDESPTNNFTPADLQLMNQRLAFLNSAPVQGAKSPNHNAQPTKGTTVNREHKLALLNQWGVSYDNTISDADLDALIAKGKPTAPTPPAPANVAPATDPKITALETQIKNMREAQTERDFNALVATRPTVNRDEWLPKVKADPTLLNLVRQFPESPDPLAIGASNRIVMLGSPALETYNKMPAGLTRKEWRAQNFGDLRKAMHQFNPRNDNTVDSALVTHHLADGLVVVAQNRLAMLNLFSRDFGTDPIKPLATVQVRKATAAATAQQDPTNFESGDSTLDNIAVTMHQEAISFHVSNADMLNGVRLDHIAEINAEAFANLISDRVTAVITTGNFGTALTIGTAANFDADDLSPILAVAKNYRQKNLILDGGHLAYITPKTTEQLDWSATGAFGFSKIAEQNRWTGATANTAGFVCGPDAIAVASGMATELPSNEFLSLTNTTLKNGLTVRTAVWFARAGRKFWCAHDVMFGAAPGDTTQAEVLITA